jgi:hypothetical protein
VAIRYALSRWDALLRYIEDGHIEIDNNAAERSLRGVALGRNYAQFPIMRSTVTRRPDGHCSSKAPGSDTAHNFTGSPKTSSTDLEGGTGGSLFLRAADGLAHVPSWRDRLQRTCA